MLTDLLAQLNLHSLNLWAASIVGILVGGATLLLGQFLVTRGLGLKPPAPTTGGDRHYDPFLFGSHLEKRTSLRRTGNPVSIVITEPGAPDKPFDGWVMDRSVGGLCVSSPRVFPVDAYLSIRPANAHEAVPSVRVKVRHHRKHDGRFAVGCQYTESYPWSVLLLFG